jgi:hypothetical protein
MPAIGIIELLLIPLIILFLVLWVWMLIDCIKRPDDKFAYGGNYAKLIWILVIIFTGFIGSLIYYFLIKREVMEAKVLLISLVLALVIGFGMLILVTELFQPTIEFSLFLGIPSGIVSGVIVFVIAYWWLGKKQDMLNHPKKLIGLVFALIIVVWLLVKVLLIVLT